MSRIGLLCAQAMAVCLVVVGPALAKVSVVESTPERLVFEWHMGSYRLVNSGNAVAPITGSANTEVVAPDGTVLPAFSFYIGLPPGGVASATVTPIDVATERTAVSPVIRKQVPDRQPRFAQPWVSQPIPVFVERMDAVQFLLRPFLFDSRSGSMRVLRDARVTVTISGNTGYVGSLGPTSEFDAVVRQAMLNYDIARRWRTPRPSRSLSKAMRERSTVPGDGSVLYFRVGDGHAGFNEGTTNENGLVRLAGDLVAEVMGSSVDFDRLHLYASMTGELPTTRPEISTGVPDRLVQVPLLHEDHDGDGRLDSDDALVAYVTGGHDWSYDTSASEYQYHTNRYDDYRHYWLVLGSGSDALELPTADLDGLTSTVTLSRFNDYLHLERSRLKPEGERRAATLDWSWFSVTGSSPSFTQANLPLGPVDTDTTGRLLISRETVRGSQSFELVFSGQSLCDPCVHETWYEVSTWSNPELRVNYTGSTIPENYIELDYADIVYPRRLELPQSGDLTVFSPTGSGLATYQLSGLPADELVYIVRISGDGEAVSLVDTVRAGSGGEYSWTDTLGIGVRYHIATRAGFRPAPLLQEHGSSNTSPYGVVDLWEGDSCDFLLVYHSDFFSQADRLVAHKESAGRFTNPRMVDIDDIYREFSGGQLDPTALRNMVWHAKNFWPGGDQLSYVVLMGHGHWDYRGISTSEKLFIPVRIQEGGDWKCTEHYYVDSVSATVGRLPCQTVAEAEAIVDKIVDMEEVGRADFGAWRNRVVLAADNDRQGGSGDNITHYLSSEQVGDVILDGWPAIDMLKIYLFEYEFDDSWQMPAAAQALMSELNAGVGVVNYFGHGGDNVWADERLLAIDDLSEMRNAKRYPLVTSLSCSVGKFDLPGHDCLSDLMMRASQSGAIGVISSTREAWATPNTDLGLSIYRALYNLDSLYTIGQAYESGRLHNPLGSLEAYALLGDPSVRLMTPSRNVELSITDADGESVDSAKALQRITVSGTVTRRGSNTTDNSFGTSSKPAYIQIGLYNPFDSAMRKDGLPTVYSKEVSYTLPGSPLFVGRTPVSGGTFFQEILVPRNVVFDKSGTRLIAYAWQDTAMGLGFDTSLVFHGTEPNVSNDSTGPVIALRQVSSGDDDAAPAFSDVVYTTLPMSCEIVVSDENGIDVVGSGPDEGLTLEIPGVLSRRSINHTFQFDEGDYRSGTAPLVLNEGQVQPGQYRVIITARDLLENITVLKASLDIAEPTELDLNRVFNYPNPMRMREGTRFYYALPNSPYLPEHGVVLKIYTMSGKLLRTVHQPENGWFWDGRDQLGNLLPPNVYLYRITAWSNSGGNDMDESPVMKLVVHPPR